MIAQLPTRNPITRFAQDNRIKRLCTAPLNRHALIARTAGLRRGIDIAVAHCLGVVKTGAISARSRTGEGQVATEVLRMGKTVDTERQACKQQTAHHGLM